MSVSWHVWGTELGCMANLISILKAVSRCNTNKANRRDGWLGKLGDEEGRKHTSNLQQLSASSPVSVHTVLKSFFQSGAIHPYQIKTTSKWQNRQQIFHSNATWGNETLFTFFFFLSLQYYFRIVLTVHFLQGTWQIQLEKMRASRGEDHIQDR